MEIMKHRVKTPIPYEVFIVYWISKNLRADMQNFPSKFQKPKEHGIFLLDTEIVLLQSTIP